MQDTIIAMEITKGNDKVVFDGQREINIRFLTKQGADMMDVKVKKLTPEMIYNLMFPTKEPGGRKDILMLIVVCVLVFVALFIVVLFIIGFTKESNGGDLNAINLLIHGPQPRGLLGGFM